MEFKRKQRIKGRPAKHYKEWYDVSGQYRISWRDQVEGANVLPAYYACIRCLRSRVSAEGYWAFAGKRSPYKTQHAALKACIYNRKVWDKFLTIEGRSKVAHVQQLWERSRVGHNFTSNIILRDIPVWVMGKASPRLLEILCGKDQDDPTETSTNSSTPSGSPIAVSRSVSLSSSEESGTPAYDVEAKEPSTTPAQTTGAIESAPTVKEPAKAPKKSAKRRTSKSSVSGAKKRPSTTRSSPPKKKRSKSSRKKKSKPSKS